MPEKTSVLLICGDEEVSRHLREQLIVERGFSVSSEPDIQGGINALREGNFDVIIVKLKTSGGEDGESIKGLKKVDPDSAIIAILEDTDPEALKELYRIGFYDFLTRPISMEKLFFLIRKGAELHALLLADRKLTQGLKERNMALEKQNILLSKRIEESTKNLTKLYEDLRSTYMRTIKVLAQAIEARDHYTHSHSENVAKYAAAIATEMGFSAKEIETLREACELHDVGKIGIEDSILTKPYSLTPQEWEQIKKHPIIGAQILEPLTFLSDVIEMVRQHHEHYDGSGYPDGKQGEEIILSARVIHLADAYESMRSARSYRKVPLTRDDAVMEIKRNSGNQFDPKVVEAFLKVVDRL
ncbi:MAG: HD domain-containing protein [Candidatus Omnitrophota bacterium]|nr:HD domain-containing protein [Candidatus Omnitrophota bacterium]